MIKKIGIMLFLFCLIGVFSPSASAYLHFERLEVVGNGKLLIDFPESDYHAYLDHLGGPQFSDWKVHIVNEQMRVKFISETIFQYHNNGYSTLIYTYDRSFKRVDSYSLSVTGSLKIKTQKNNKVFGDGLEASISATYKMDHMTEVIEKSSIKVNIEPGTQVVYYLKGEGKITNGVAKRYAFWLEIDRGGFEIFTLSSHYPVLEITKI